MASNGVYEGNDAVNYIHPPRLTRPHRNNTKRQRQTSAERCLSTPLLRTKYGLLPWKGGTTKINTETVRKAFFGQATGKTPGPDRISFNMLRLIWNGTPPEKSLVSEDASD